jgi:hypothetical protein
VKHFTIAEVPFKPGAMLEGVLQRELSGAIITDSAGDLPKVAVGHAAVWRSVIGNVEGIEEIGPEFHPMLMPEREALEDGHVDVLKARSAQRAGPTVPNASFGCWAKTQLPSS